MCSLSTTWSYPVVADAASWGPISADCLAAPKSWLPNLQTSFIGTLSAEKFKMKVSLKILPRRAPLLGQIKCKEEEEISVSVERFPYYSYMDSTSGKLEPASGARASIPGEEYWPEGTASRVRAARAPEPTGASTGTPSYGRMPGSRRKRNKSAISESESSALSVASSDSVVLESSNDTMDDCDDVNSEYVTYKTEPEKELTQYELDKERGAPHPFIDPKARKPTGEPLSEEELWWNWKSPDKNDHWSRWQRRRPDVETVFLKAMAETGQIKLHGEHPTLTECALYRARRHIYKEERLQAEKDRLERDGPLAYYSEWVKEWRKDTSREAVQKHFEETGDDENTQLMEMFEHQTAAEFRIMMGTDVRIRRDPLAMRMREDQIKQIWGGDPVYPTINYIQDPNEITDYRGPDFHEPTPEMEAYLKESGRMITREELDEILAKEKARKFEQVDDIDEEAMAAPSDGSVDDEDEDSEVEVDDEEDEKITRNWSAFRTTPGAWKSKDKPKKDGPLSLQEAMDDSENLTDFLMDFDDDDEP